MQQFQTARIAENISNPTEFEGVQILCFLWIYRGCGEDPEKPASCIMEISAPKTFSENMPRDHNCQPRLQHNNLVLSAPPHISTFLFFTLLTYLQLPNLYVNVLLPKQCNTHVYALVAGTQNSRINGPSLRMDRSHVNRCS